MKCCAYTPGINVLSIDICKYVLEDKKERIFSEIFNVVNNECRYTINDDVYFRYNIFQLYDNNQNVRGIILSIEDISQELKMKNEVVEKDKNNTLNKIIASIAHEIRNPLMSIKMLVELMPTKANDSNFQKQMVEIVPKEVDRVNNLIEALMDYAKPQNNDKEPVLVNDIIDYCAMLLIPLLDSKKISIKVEYEEKISIIINKDQLKQLIINLLINSLESLMEKQEKTNEEKELLIKVRLWKNCNVVYLEIFDEGLGMSSQQIEKCTDLFFTTKSNGTGIGLALAKQFVESNNGKILIESKKYEFTKITMMFGGYDCV
jgi:polar amino acid transport system substrate-binding protein